MEKYQDLLRVFSPASSAIYTASWEGVGKWMAEIMAGYLLCLDILKKRK